MPCVADEGLVPLPYALLAGRATPSAWTLVLDHNGCTPHPDLVARLSTTKQVLARTGCPTTRRSPPSWASSPPLRIRGSYGAGHRFFFGDHLDLPRRSGLSFDVVITGESVEVGKPGPAPYLAAASAIGLEPGRCWALEDSVQGLASAAAAGARAVHFMAPGASCDGHHVATEGCVASIDAFVRLTGVVVAA